MKKIRHIIKHFLIFLIIVSVAILPFIKNSKAESTVSVFGYVEDTGVGCEGVKVTISGTSNSATTNANGYYQINNVPVGNQVITFDYSDLGVDYSSAEIEQVNFELFTKNMNEYQDPITLSAEYQLYYELLISN